MDNPKSTLDTRELTSNNIPCNNSRGKQTSGMWETSQGQTFLSCAVRSDSLWLQSHWYGHPRSPCPQNVWQSHNVRAGGEQTEILLTIRSSDLTCQGMLRMVLEAGTNMSSLLVNLWSNDKCLAGHARVYISFDLLYRFLSYLDYKVSLPALTHQKRSLLNHLLYFPIWYLTWLVGLRARHLQVNYTRNFTDIGNPCTDWNPRFQRSVLPCPAVCTTAARTTKSTTSAKEQGALLLRPKQTMKHSVSKMEWHADDKIINRAREAGRSAEALSQEWGQLLPPFTNSELHRSMVGSLTMPAHNSWTLLILAKKIVDNSHTEVLWEKHDKVISFSTLMTWWLVEL